MESISWEIDRWSRWDDIYTNLWKWRGSLRTVCPGTDPMMEGKIVKSPPPEEEAPSETTYDELTTAPIPQPLYHLRERGRKIRSKVAPGKKGGVEENHRIIKVVKDL